MLILDSEDATQGGGGVRQLQQMIVLRLSKTTVRVKAQSRRFFASNTKHIFPASLKLDLFLIESSLVDHNFGSIPTDYWNFFHKRKKNKETIPSQMS